MELANSKLQDSWSNADGMTAEQYEAASKQTMAAIQAAKAKRDAEEARTGCHKKLWPSKKNKQEYADCLANAAKLKEVPNVPSYPSYTPKKPFLSTPSGVTVVVLSVAALAIGGYFAVKHFKK
jgi:hypothetical protein